MWYAICFFLILSLIGWWLLFHDVKTSRKISREIRKSQEDSYKKYFITKDEYDKYPIRIGSKIVCLLDGSSFDVIEIKGNYVRCDCSKWGWLNLSSRGYTFEMLRPKKKKIG